jgi:hypothetical protein
VNSSFSRTRIASLAVALASAAFAAPAAQAHHAPGNNAKASPPSASVWTASSREVDRLGPKYVPLQHPLSLAPVTVVRVVRPGGFDWGDAAIGAGVSGIALALVAGLALLVTRRSRRAGVPERSELAGA